MNIDYHTGLFVVKIKHFLHIRLALCFECPACELLDACMTSTSMSLLPFIAAIHRTTSRSRQIFPCMLTVLPDFGSFLMPKTLTIFFSSAEFLQSIINNFVQFLHVAGVVLPFFRMNKEYY